MTSKYTTIRVKLSCPKDFGSTVSREALEEALCQLLSSGAVLYQDGYDYTVSEATVVGR